MLRLIDTHCHLYSDAFDADREQVIQNAKKMGVDRILLPNVDLQTVEGMHQLVKNHPGVCYPMMGLHPCDVKPDYETEIAQLFSFFDTHTYCAVGEIGIDLYWDKSTQDIQEKAFLMQVDFALSKGLPIAIHSRNATHRIIELLKAYKGKGLRGVFHCFSESLELAHEIIKLEGFYLGIGGVLTFKNAGLPEVLAQIDLQHIILETDSPYLPPVPHRGKRNEPAYTRLVAEKLADVKGMSLLQIAEITTRNAELLFGL
jgi:TatD DNase family protein